MASTPRGAEACFGPFRLLGVLHEGRLARTYRATEPDGAQVSLKVLHPFAAVQEQRRALLREAELQARCAHPAIVVVRAAGELEAGAYIARDFVLGLTWGELCRRATQAGVAIPEAVLRAVGEALLSALDCVHGQRDADGRRLGLVHRDVTPANVLVGLDGAVKLTDFGLAHGPALHGALAEDEIAQGTLRYLPPEVARGEPPDERSDLFQLALCLGECLGGALRGRTPKWGEAAAGDAVGALQQAFVRAAGTSRLASRAPRWVAVLGNALSPRAAERVRSAGEMTEAWRAAFDDPPAPPERIAQWLVESGLDLAA